MRTKDLTGCRDEPGEEDEGLNGMKGEPGEEDEGMNRMRKTKGLNRMKGSTR